MGGAEERMDFFYLSEQSHMQKWRGDRNMQGRHKRKSLADLLLCLLLYYHIWICLRASFAMSNWLQTCEGTETEAERRRFFAVFIFECLCCSHSMTYKTELPIPYRTVSRGTVKLEASLLFSSWRTIYSSVYLQILINEVAKTTSANPSLTATSLTPPF